MRCPGCGTENRDRAKFCVKCGGSLVLSCPKCGTALPAGALFCDSCGTPVSAPSPDPLAETLKRLAPKEYAERLLAARGHVSHERRIVTILFCDIKGSSAIASALDPEEVLDIVNGAFECLISPVFRYEGTLTQLMGDAILAFFGAPFAHDDDPERACRAALDILAAIREYSAKLERKRGISGFNVRVGINTGPVVVGEVGTDLRVAYTAVGDTINMAARMEQSAEPGTVLVTEETYRLVAPLFATKSLGEIAVKGREEPMPVYRVLAPRPVGKVRGIAGLSSPLVGRDREIGELREAMGRLQAGLGGIVTIVGEAGIGKSRLAAEARKEANASLVQWVEGRCLSYGTSIAYLLWLDVLRSLVGVTEDATPAAVRDRLRERAQSLCPDKFAQVYPYLARLMSLPLEPDVEKKLADSDGQALKEATFAAVETVLECTANCAPMVLVCEDLHWADSTSIELLERLLALTDRAPVLFVCALRPERDRPSWRIGETCRRIYPHRYSELSLAPLSAAESQVLVSNLLAIEGLPAALKERILKQAEGNPFYLEEILRSLMDTGAIARDEATGRWEAAQNVAEIALPDTLQGVLLARIDRLQEDTKRILQMASVIGRTFLYRILAAMAEEEQGLDRHLITLQREEMIRERARIPELEYIFKHYLTQEAAYNGLLKKHRRAYHKQVAEALERLFPERRDELCGFLAYHWERADVDAKAIEYLLKAGDQARVLYAHQEAVGFYERALAFLKTQGDTDRAARTLMKVGLTYHTAFDYERSRKAYDEAFALQRQVEGVDAAAASPALQTLRLVLQDPPTLDPSMAEDNASVEPIAQMFSGLVAPGSEQDVLPDVARGWEISPDGRKYVFHLRDDAFWSDGAPVTAGDFEYAWKRVLSPAVASPGANLLYDLKGARAFHQGEQPDATQVGVRAVDDRTLVVELEQPTGYLLHLLTNNVTYALPRHVVERFAEAWTEPAHLVTNGPFQLESWEPGQSMTFVRNPRYRGSFGGNVGRVQATLLPRKDWRPALSAWEQGEFDLLSVAGLPPSEVTNALRRRPGARIQRFPMPSTHFLVLNVTRPPFDDLRVRRAFVLATDREGLVGEGQIGGALPATGGFTPPALPGHCRGIALPFDPRRARELLAEAGYPHGHGFPAVDFLTILGPALETALPRLRSQWKENLGVDIPWQTVEWKELLQRSHEDPPHMYFTGWNADYPDPDNFLRVAPAGGSAWRSEIYNTLVEKARHEVDQPERMRLYGQAERIIAEEAPVILLDYAEAVILLQPWVTRVPVSPGGVLLWRDIVIEPHGEAVPRRESEAAAVARSELQMLRLSLRNPPTLDPSVAVDTASGELIAQIFSGLVVSDAEQDVLPDVARSWEVSPDGREYTFHLRDDVFWIDSTPVTAGDFEYAWKRVLDAARISEINASLFYDVKGARAFHQGEEPDAARVGIRAPDDRTLVVELEEPTGYFLHFLTCMGTQPVPRHVVEQFGDAWAEPDHLVTNGPFQLECWEKGKSMVFVRNPRYHAAGSGNVERVQVSLMEPDDWRTAMSALDKGALDLFDVTGVAPSEISNALQRRPGSRVLRFPEPSVHFLVFDATRPPFDDPRVRRAFVLATDRERFVSEAGMSGSLPATGGFTPPGLPGHCEGVALPYDPAQARELLAEAGYPGGRGFPAIEFLIILGPPTESAAHRLQSQWKDNLGLDIVWETMEWSRYLLRTRQEPPHIYAMGWNADYPDPDSFLRVARKHSAWRSEPYEALVEQARHETNQAERMRLYSQAERTFAQEAPIMPLAYGEAVILLQPWLTKVPISPSGFPFWKGIVIEPHEEPATRPQAEEVRVAAPPVALQTLNLSCGEPLTLDPSMAGDSVSIDVIAQLFSGLVAVGPDMDVLPDVASGWEVPADGRTYLFRLRGDARWSDGRPVTAGDFEYAWKRVLHPSVGSPGASLLYDVKGARAFNRGENSDADGVGVRAMDDRTLLVELEEPTGYFLHLLTCPGTYALPRHVVEKHAGAWTEVSSIVTNGPFRLTSWERGCSMNFARNPQYHGVFSGNVGQVRLVFAPPQEWQSKLSLYDAGGLDVLNTSGFEPSVGADVQRRYAASRVLRTTKLATFFLVFDVTRPPFDDPRVRRAFVIGTDRGSLAGEGWMGGLRSATGGLTPPRMPGHCEGITLPFDPARARALLADAGYPEGRGFPAMDCMAMIVFRGQEIARNLQTQWRQNLGMEIPWKTMEWGKYVETIQSRPPHVFYIGWSADYPDPDNFLRVGLHIQSAWRNEAYEALVEQARRVRDQGQRMSLYRQAEKILADEAPILIAGYKESAVLIQPWVKEFPSSVVAEYVWKDVVIEPH